VAALAVVLASPVAAETEVVETDARLAEEAASLTEPEAEVLPGEQDEAAQPATPALPPPAVKPAAIKSRFLISQFADMPVAGGADETLRYGGKIDAYFDISGSAIGIDDSLSVHIHPEFKFGESANGEIGLLPSNTQLFYPDEGEQFDLSVNITKRWKSGTSLTVGKVNVLDLAAQLPVVGGGGHDGFQNLAMALPPSAIVPGSIFGALLNVPTKKALYRLWVFDPRLQSTKTGFESPFSKGVAFLGSVTVPVKIGGKPGYYALKLAGSTRSELATEALPAALVPGPGSTFGNRKGEFSAVLAGYQFLQLYPEAPGKGWGIFGQVYASRGDPTFLDRSGFIGISGNPRARPQDRFGVAWFRYSLTDGLVDTLATRVPLEDEEGIEAFYTVGLDKNFRVTADLQVVDSAVAFRETGWLLGLRLTADF
jgi:porin